MKLIIGEPNTEIRPTQNTFSIAIRTYWGDADGYATVILKGFRRNSSDEELLKDLIQTLKLTKAEYPNGRGWRDKYSNERFLAWFEDDTDYAQPDVDEFMERTQCYPDWPVDPHEYFPNTIDSWTVTYYDENCVPHTVAIDYET